MKALDLSAAGITLGPFEQAYTWRDAALYALAVGAGPEDLKYLLDPAPRVLPTFGVLPAFEPVFAAFDKMGGDMVKLLHSAQRTELLKPFPASGVVETSAKVLGIWDMRMGALANIETVSSIGGEPHARTMWSLLIRDAGGFGGNRPPPLLRVRVPKDAQPAFSVRWQTATAQALLYRLTGDVNPIHSHPEVAQAAGFDRPILHGLCSYGFLARSAIEGLCGGDPDRFVALDARFTAPVLPGQTLLAEGFLLEPGKAAVTVKIEETGELAIGHGLLEYRA